MSQQEMIEEFNRKIQEEIEVRFLLHMYQMTQISPQFSGYAYCVHMPSHIPPRYVHNMLLPLPFLPQQPPPFMATRVPTRPIVSGTTPPINYMADGLRSIGNNTNIRTNIYASGVITPLLVPIVEQPNILNTFHMNNNHTMQEVAETRSTIQTSVVSNSNRVNSDTSMNVDYGQQYHHEVDTTTDRGQDVVRGNISAEADALSMGEDNYAIDWVEHEMPKLLEDHMIDRDCLPLPESTSISDLVLASDMPDILGFVNEVYLHDDTDR
ncbi:hypothetical protein HU200_052863 [Digitaria exilis]|uniref:Uncharacterized protein n=1 Tax=Digitaria exilis TaxID=1010633 RepID=A0A835E406_9POAL|nr:hypothetical protein HU200_052863 [Digitaria exilis]